MTSVIRVAAAGAILAGPTALAFFAGGYFDTPRLAAAVGAWFLVLVAALTVARPLPRRAPGRLAIGGLALLAVWTAISFAWAPLSDPASAAVERLLLYVGGLVAATALLGSVRTQAWCEPALAAGAAIVIGYGVAGRLLPGLIHESASVSAAGRLEQPLTYWNAMGALAAMGLVLAVRVAGTQGRSNWLRCAAAAASVVLGLGLYLSFSRGALAAFVLGAVVLLALELTVDQLFALGIAVVGAGVAAAVASTLDAVRTLHGSMGTREAQGALMLGTLALLCLLAAAGEWYVLRRSERRLLRRPRHMGAAVTALLVALFAGLVLYAATDKGSQHPLTGANPARFGSLETNRYDYWRVAMTDGFAKHPIAGVGAGGFAALWLRYRTITERVRVAHSLYVETLAELGLVGFAFLLACFVGVVAAARRAYATAPALSAGPIAAIVVFATHTAVDWDWEMPAVSLVALALAGFLIGAGDAPTPELSPTRASAAPRRPAVPAASA